MKKLGLKILVKANQAALRITPWAALPLVLLFVVPLVFSLVSIIPSFFDVAALTALLQHPQFWGGICLSLFTGIISTVAALYLATIVAKSASSATARDTGFFIALPHLALAVGFSFLIMPTGVLARVIAMLITGWTEPPQIITAQDPWGLSLIASLVLKETPFLIWAMLSIMNRQDVKPLLAQHTAIGKSLGYGKRAIWNRVLLPQILPRLVWPIIAVFAYGMTVVDMALVIGPTQPPTLAVIIWRDLNDGEVINNARGAAGVLLLTAAIAAVIAIAWLTLLSTRQLRISYLTAGPRSERKFFNAGRKLWQVLRVIYGAIFLILVLQSISGQWPFPNLFAQHFTLKSWQTLFTDYAPLFTTLCHAAAASMIALLLSVAWLESQSPGRDKILLIICGASLCLPALLLGLAQYRLYLQLGLTGTHTALFFAHLLPTTAYVFIMLQGPYRDYDPRWAIASHGLRISPLKFLIQVKWPMLKSVLWSAAAIGFAVATAQFVSAQLASSGRHATLAMEAVSLTSGGNRPLIATYALALMALPMLGFFMAAVLGKPRWRNA